MNNKTSKSGKLMVRIAASAIATSALLSPQATFAQASGLNNNNPQPLQDFQTKDNTDPFSGRSTGGGIFDLIHRSRLGGGRSIEEFNTEQRQNLNDAAADFRNKQRQMLEKQAAPAPGAAPTEITAPAP
ncbi:MAG: hypothetical protein JGK24_22135 [Microcoleus sp. PH2017_29_MFU_D_A]|jgi:hypothetical protein|uniref:hypothetical protein n=2 Tax=Microcoleus TaxID=44471 RepID=UPI001D4DB119|nr:MULTISPECIES: hypothetical protein [unclassified Microcoleus]MCC3420474.1 hypothetical protein [Microcoleus sp. PH2017_07_MST_O_A]MCC3429220.1 hypothetical protein [Microcoleus sp. PH2017_04_SCI_O_A]MCC3465930.1 hypothetical protein [Microcoleus sp. PH2017_06_SFM_O_A]MCC3504678.1 hypothetical protein [Microcoleus sp. PH2017_19_SFW_U_A]MCC3513174.1 hypothetical protein [Microcoleus sp. PH2017_17_BER_D_A]TAE08375.1 MAG: hypothetical protein EAZ94_25430 [Oscillatoriales cyanobacterium]